MDIPHYFSLAPSFKRNRYIYANKNQIVIEGAKVYPMKCESVSEATEYVMYEIPENAKSVVITPLIDNAEFEYFDNQYSFSGIKDDTYGILQVASKNAAEGETVDFTVKNAPKGSNASVSISGFQSARTVKYKTTMKFHYNADVPEGSSVRWFLNDQDAGTSDVLEVKEAVQDFRVQVKVLSEDGKTVLAASESETVTVKKGFFDRLGAFFRRLFGIHLTIDQK